MLLITKLMESYPYLDSNNRVGWTDYIDFFELDEVKHPVMVGRDRYDRFYIVIKVIIDNKVYMQTFFQRRQGYKGDFLTSYLIMGCGHATQNIIETEGGTTKEQFEFIEELLLNGYAVMKEEYRPFYINVNKKVFLFDEKKYNAILKIQRAWRKCRYDPSYKMCHRVQINGMLRLGIDFAN